MSTSSAVAGVCADLGGFARTSDLAARGISRHALGRAVAAGAVERVREGLYAHPAADPLARTAAAHGGMLACVSAAVALGLWVPPFEGVHVAVPMRGRVHRHARCNCVTHRTSLPVRPGRRSGAVRMLVEILRCRGEETCFVALESALRRRMLRARDIPRLRAAVPAASRWLVDLARSDADSGLESLLRFRLFAYSIELRSQVAIPGVGTVDFVLGDRLILEVDGRENHDGPSKRHKDLVRDAIAAALGFETLRFDYALVLHDWDTVLAAILARVDAGAHLAPRRG